MCIDNPNEYRKMMKGYNIPFNMREKYTRVDDDDIAHKYKVRYKKIPFSDVKKMVQDIRDKREAKKQKAVEEANERYLKKMRYIKKMHEKLRQESFNKLVDERLRADITGVMQPTANQRRLAELKNRGQSVLDLKDLQNLKNMPEQKNLKVTLDVLTKMHFNDFNTVGEAS